MPFDFTADGYREFSQAIINANGDQATITSVLADMQDTFVDNIALVTKQTEEVDKITEENNRLRESNMSLYLRVGEQAKQKLGGSTGEGEQEEEAPASVKDYMSTYFKKLKEG